MNKNTTSESASPFFRKALEEHTDALITALIDGLVNTRYAQQEDMWLKENGHEILLRLMEIYCHICHPKPGSIVQGWDLDVLERLLSRILATLLHHPLQDAQDLAVADELLCMMAELNRGDWFA